MIAQRTAPADTSEQPSPAAAALELVSAAMASVKPSALVRIEARVSELRARRVGLSAELNKANAAAFEGQQRFGTRPANVDALERKLADLDADIRSARAEMHERRKAYAVEFQRVAIEFKSQVAKEIRQHLPGLIRAFHTLDALDNGAMRAGVEYRSGGADMRVALQYLNTLV